MNSEESIDRLNEHFVSSVCKLFGDRPRVPPEDNAPVHKSSLMEMWKRQHRIPMLPWPAQSPDLSSIEKFDL
jgi:hypothetical protein